MHRILLCLFVLCTSLGWSKTVDLKTGNWLWDRYRSVELDRFDYMYLLKGPQLRGQFIELEDGSTWKLREMEYEAESFYAARKPPIEFRYVTQLVRNWQPDDLLIFHVISDEERLLVYNVNQDQLFDVKPYQAPLEPSLTITVIDPVAKQMELSDNSIWKYEALNTYQKWRVGDPILIAKATPSTTATWTTTAYGKVTHVLLNLRTWEYESTIEHVYSDGVNVRRVQ